METRFVVARGGGGARMEVSGCERKPVRGILAVMETPILTVLMWITCCGIAL